MNGIYNIIVSSKRIRYEFNIRRNITVIKGDSATGKTTLINMIRDYNKSDELGIKVQCDVPCVAVDGKDWKEQINRITESIIFIDDNKFLNSKEFADTVEHTNNYYVLITRDKLNKLQYNDEYNIRKSNKYGVQECNELYSIEM